MHLQVCDQWRFAPFLVCHVGRADIFTSVGWRVGRKVNCPPEAENCGVSWRAVVASLVIFGRLVFLNCSGGLSEMDRLCRRFHYEITKVQPTAFSSSCCNVLLTSPGFVVRPLSRGLSFSDVYSVWWDGCNFWPVLSEFLAVTSLSCRRCGP